MKYLFLIFFVSQQAFSYSKETYSQLMEVAGNAFNDNDLFTACEMFKELSSMALKDGLQPDEFKKMETITCKYYEISSAAESNDLLSACELSKELNNVYFDENIARKNSEVSEKICREYENQASKQSEDDSENSIGSESLHGNAKIVDRKDHALPIKYAITQDSIQIYNDGDCPLYKVEIRTYSPNKEGLKGIVNLINSRVMGLDNFTKKIGTIEKYESILVQRNELLNMKGERLSHYYIVGTWHISASYCGENRSINIAGD